MTPLPKTIAALLLAASCSQPKTISLLGSQPALGNDSGKSDSAPTNPGCKVDGDCNTTNPRCDTLLGSCVQCMVNEDCTTSLCNPVAHTCSGCVTNADCGGATPICDRDDRKCVECDNASQCKDGEVCAWGAHRCAPACQTDSDCAGSGHPICAAASRVCVECTSDADCATLNLEPHCDLRLGACVECLSDSHCSSSRCERFEHLCVECTSDADCAGGMCDRFFCSR